VLTVEQRLYTEWHPFSLFRVGAAAFVDVGRTWGASPLSDPSDTWLSDVGFGLRIGSTRSGLGRMIHFDVAFPLSGQDNIDNIQFLISTRKGF
jgi:hemolysin activation/secretion protein